MRNHIYVYPASYSPNVRSTATGAGGARVPGGSPATASPQDAGSGYRRQGGCGKANRWKHPRAPPAKRPQEEGSTEAALESLRDTRAECMVTQRKPPEEGERGG